LKKGTNKEAKGEQIRSQRRCSSFLFCPVDRGRKYRYSKNRYMNGCSYVLESSQKGDGQYAESRTPFL
ncbi:hypothetical protein, partial [Sellimonas intestinalis]|uniref:hypothetical protein n=1 Tax=Sellimonas intestinalis TaxID=1653434 RepID=UPI00266D68A1